MAIGQLTHLAFAATLSTSSSASGVIPNDGSVVAGDVLLAACVMPSGSRTFSISGGGAGGWTSLGVASQSGHMSQMWWRIADVGDLGATITVTPSTGNIRQVLLLGKISGAAPLNPVTAASNTSASASSKTTPSLGSTPVGREVSVVWDTRGASTPQTSAWTAPSGETKRAEAFTTSGSGSSSGAWGDSDSTVSGTIGSRLWTADVAALGSAWTLAIAQAEQALAPARLESSASIPAPAVSPGTVTLSPTLLASAATVPTPAVTPGVASVTPEHLASTATVHSPTAAPGAVDMTPPQLGSASEVYEAAVTPGQVTVVPATLEPAGVLHVPAVGTGPMTLLPDRLESNATLPAPTLTPGAAVIAPARLDPTAVIPTPTLSQFEQRTTVTVGQPRRAWEVGEPW